MAVPLSVLCIVMAMIAPLPAFVLDALIAVNITLSVLVLLIGLYITRPVEFVAALETAYALGARLMVEVGPNRVLSGFARDVLGPRGVSVIALDHPRRSDALADGVAALWAATCVVHSK